MDMDGNEQEEEPTDDSTDSGDDSDDSEKSDESGYATRPFHCICRRSFMKIYLLTDSREFSLNLH